MVEGYGNPQEIIKISMKVSTRTIKNQGTGYTFGQMDLVTKVISRTIRSTGREQ